MTHVVFKQSKGLFEFSVDGVDLSKHVLAEGFKIELGEDPSNEVLVHCVLAASTVEVDLPDGVVVVERAEAAA